MSWDNMQGDEKRRFCEHCQLHVHNLSAMSRDEQIATLSSPRCITYVAPTNAHKVDIATWINSQTQPRPWFFRLAAAFVATFATLFLSSCRTMGPPMIPPSPDGKNPVTTGHSTNATTEAPKSLHAASHDHATDHLSAS